MAQVTAEQVIETKRLQATVLSPLHIGSHQQTLEKTEYIVQNQQVYLARPDKVFSSNRPLVTETDKQNWLTGQRTSLTRLYQNRVRENPGFRLPNDFFYYNLRTNAVLDGESQYRPFERNAFQQAYIAGSSLKGALRNAWLYHYLNTHPAALKNVAEEMNRLFTDYRENKISSFTLKNKINSAIDENYFRAGFGAGAANSINGDMFRLFRVSDSPALENRQLAAEDVRVLCDYKEYSCDAKGNPIFYEKTRLVPECLQENQTFTFEISFNKKLCEHYKDDKEDKNIVPESIKVWLDTADSFFREVWEFDRKFFTGEPEPGNRLRERDVVAPALGSFYRDKLPKTGDGWLIRVGAGSGLHSVTPALRLRPETEEEDNYMLDNMDDHLEYQIGYYTFWDEKEKAGVFPKSRKVVYRTNRQYCLPLGWLLIKEV